MSYSNNKSERVQKFKENREGSLIKTKKKNIKHNYNQSNKYYSAGMKAYKEKRWNEAIQYLEESIIEEGEYYRAVFILGKCYSRIKKNDVAEEKYKRVIEIDEKNIHARTELGRLYASQGKKAEAERLYNEAIEIGKKEGKIKETIPARTELGRLYATKQEAGAETEEKLDVYAEEYSDLFKNHIEEMTNDNIDELAIIRAKIHQNKITQEDIEKLRENVVNKVEEAKYRYILAIIAANERMGQRRQAVNYIKSVKKEGVNTKFLNEVEQRLKSNKKAIFDMSKWDIEIGWQICDILIEEAEPNEDKATIEMEVKPNEEQKQEEVETQIEGSREIREERMIETSQTENRKGKSKRKKQKDKKKEEQKLTDKIYQTLPIEIEDKINKIRQKYYIKMQDVNTQAKYVKRYNTLEELLLKDSSNKRARAEIMLIMINEGYATTVARSYPKEYEFIDGLIKKYLDEELNAKTVQQKIDEYCM